MTFRRGLGKGALVGALVALAIIALAHFAPIDPAFEHMRGNGRAIYYLGFAGWPTSMLPEFWPFGTIVSRSLPVVFNGAVVGLLVALASKIRSTFRRDDG